MTLSNKTPKEKIRTGRLVKKPLRNDFSCVCTCNLSSEIAYSCNLRPFLITKQPWSFSSLSAELLHYDAVKRWNYKDTRSRDFFETKHLVDNALSEVGGQNWWAVCSDFIERVVGNCSSSGFEALTSFNMHTRLLTDIWPITDHIFCLVNPTQKVNFLG